MPKGVYVRKPREPKGYPAQLVEQVRQLYQSGMTQSEVAATTGVTQKIIWRLMALHGLKARIAAKRDQRGSANHAWKGRGAGYQALHLRMERLMGKPRRCQECGTTDPNKTYDWANLTGNYSEPGDYKRLCRSCHWKIDQTILNIHHMRGGGALCPNEE